MGRNIFRDYGFNDLDMSIFKNFRLKERYGFQFRWEVFNVLNHPAFADPVPFLSSPWFGQSTSMQNLMLGSGSANTGLPPLFQNGGFECQNLPRAVERIGSQQRNRD
jgi:hypothetical protein